MSTGFSDWQDERVGEDAETERKEVLSMYREVQAWWKRYESPHPVAEVMIGNIFSDSYPEKFFDGAYGKHYLSRADAGLNMLHKAVQEVPMSKSFPFGGWFDETKSFDVEWPSRKVTFTKALRDVKTLSVKNVVWNDQANTLTFDLHFPPDAGNPLGVAHWQLKKSTSGPRTGQVNVFFDQTMPNGEHSSAFTMSREHEVAKRFKNASDSMTMRMLLLTAEQYTKTERQEFGGGGGTCLPVIVFLKVMSLHGFWRRKRFANFALLDELRKESRQPISAHHKCPKCAKFTAAQHQRCKKAEEVLAWVRRLAAVMNPDVLRTWEVIAGNMQKQLPALLKPPTVNLLTTKHNSRVPEDPNEWQTNKDLHIKVIEQVRNMVHYCKGHCGSGLAMLPDEVAEHGYGVCLEYANLACAYLAKYPTPGNPKVVVGLMRANDPASCHAWIEWYGCYYEPQNGNKVEEKKGVGGGYKTWYKYTTSEVSQRSGCKMYETIDSNVSPAVAANALVEMNA